MIQFNLLPDVKIQYLKARRQEHLVIVIATFATLASIAVVLILLGTVYGVQKKNLSDLEKDIASNSHQLQSTPNLNKILTVQSQLEALPTLHNNKPGATRLASYLSQVTPSAASISKLNVDFVRHTITITGASDTLDTVNTFTDTLKFTTFSDKTTGASGRNAFSNVVLTTFSRDKTGAEYTIDTAFNPIIFNESDDVTLTVPNIISTRSTLEQPTALFQGSSGSSNTGNGQ